MVVGPAMAGTAAAVMVMAKDAGVGADVAVVPGKTWCGSKNISITSNKHTSSATKYLQVRLGIPSALLFYMLASSR